MGGILIKLLSRLIFRLEGLVHNCEARPPRRFIVEENMEASKQMSTIEHREIILKKPGQLAPLQAQEHLS